MSGTNLYAAGCFTNAGEAAVNNIALWDGSSWSALGSGTGPGVSSLAVSDNTLYAGGYFTNAGGAAVNYIAQAIIGPPILTISNLNSMPVLSWKFIPGSTNLLWATTSPGLPCSQWQVIATNVVGTHGRSQFTDQDAASTNARFYRISAP